ncbi:MAG: hypothetical protein OXN84_20270 [Albidovulum sp.]|nr:hypothetical protein [Albidovulum sp.]MDE0530836.1 hypothetical protein [Albidovulum sp.]
MGKINQPSFFQNALWLKVIGLLDEPRRVQKDPHESNQLSSEPLENQPSDS